MVKGHVNVLDFVQHVVEIFCLSKQIPDQIKPHPPACKGGRRWAVRAKHKQTKEGKAKHRKS